MEFTNTLYAVGTTPVALETLLLLLAPFAPHIAEELWHHLGKEESIHLAPWPTFDPDIAQEEVVTLVIQVNGRVRDKLEIPRGLSGEAQKEQALKSPRVQAHVNGKQVINVITVPDKLVNIVVKS